MDDVDRTLLLVTVALAGVGALSWGTIGWALRDATRWDPRGVQAFVDAHPALSTVARREAVRGLARSSRP